MMCLMPEYTGYEKKCSRRSPAHPWISPTSSLPEAPAYKLDQVSSLPLRLSWHLSQLPDGIYISPYCLRLIEDSCQRHHHESRRVQ